MPETKAAMYSKYGESLRGLISKAQFLDQLPRHALTPEQTSNPEKLPQGKPDQKIVSMKKVGQGQSAYTVKLDVKIGKSTASKTQLEMEDHASPLMKKLK